jgi:hypothetical protein
LLCISGNLERPVIVREYYDRHVFGLRSLVDDGVLSARGEFPLLAYRLYARYQDMDVEAVAVLAEAWFLSDESYVERLRIGCDKRLGAFAQMVALARDASGLAKKPPLARTDVRKFAFLTNISGQRYDSSLITMGHTHTRACANAVKIFARHLAETEEPSVLAVASGIAEDATGYWCTDLGRPGTDRNCTVMDMDGSYPFENGKSFVVYTV